MATRRYENGGSESPQHLPNRLQSPDDGSPRAPGTANGSSKVPNRLLPKKAQMSSAMVEANKQMQLHN